MNIKVTDWSHEVSIFDLSEDFDSIEELIKQWREDGYLGLKYNQECYYLTRYETDEERLAEVERFLEIRRKERQLEELQRKEQESKERALYLKLKAKYE